MSDLVKRLRLYGKAGESPSMVSDYSEDLALLAADEITALRARLEAEKEKHLSFYKSACDWQRRAERAEAALATARRDALEEAAGVALRHFGSEPTNEQMHDVCDIAAAIRALANEAET